MYSLPLFQSSTPAYLSFSSHDVKPESGPILPEELLPSPPIDLKQLCQKTQHAPSKSAQQLCDAILRGETVEQLIPKIGMEFYLLVCFRFR